MLPISIFCLSILFLPSGVELVLVSKLAKSNVKESSWQRIAETSTAKNRESCAMSAKRPNGYLAFAYDKDTQQCERAPATCLRPTEDETPKEVYMSSVTTEYLGCYTDSSNRNLPVSKGTNILTLTPDWCIVLCSQDGYGYSGVNNGKQCWCGNQRPMDARKTLVSSCNSPCTGDSTQTCGGNVIQQVYYTYNTKVPYWRIPQQDREQWQLTGTESSDETQYPFEQIYDGSYGLTKAYLSGNKVHAYLQIEMDSSQLVKSVQMWANKNNKLTMSHLEVRIGDSEAVAANTKDPSHNKMCHNKLCYRSGDDHAGNLGAYVDEDCITPLTGKYITIQKYTYQAIGNYQLQLDEVEVVVYCDGSFAEDEMCPEPTPDEDCETLLPWTHMGCFSTRIVPTQVSYTHTLTPLECAKKCKDTNPDYKAFGLYYYRYCYCGTEPFDTADYSDYHGCHAYCVGDYTHVCGGDGNRMTAYNMTFDTVPLEVWHSSASAKQNWVATSSSSEASSPPSLAIDGATNLAFATTAVDAYPWLQIDLGASILIQQLKIFGTSLKYQSVPHVEIRIGDTDVSTVAQLGKKICVNKVCHTTGASLVRDSTFHCTVPRQGRYVSLQRNRKAHSGTYGTEWSWQMLIMEVDIQELQG